MTKGKNKKMKSTKIYLFLLPPPRSQDERLLQPLPHPPPPQTFFTAKIFENFLHRYMGIWTKGVKIDRMAIIGKNAKMQQLPPPPS